jgi:hypothetical protein
MTSISYHLPGQLRIQFVQTFSLLLTARKIRPTECSPRPTVPVFIWTLQFYKTYYSNVFYF